MAGLLLVPTGAALTAIAAQPSAAVPEGVGAAPSTPTLPVPGPAPAASTPPAPRTVKILEPASGAGLQPGATLKISWSGAFDITNLLYAVEVKNTNAGWWTPIVTPYSCAVTSSSFPTGTCSTTWTPTIAGQYTVRVRTLSQDANATVTDTICSLNITCDAVTPVFVDNTPPQIPLVCALNATGVCASNGSKITTRVISAQVSVTDDVHAQTAVLIATSSLGTKSATVSNLDTNAQNFTANFNVLDLVSILSEPVNGTWQGKVTLSATAFDAAGNSFTTTGPTYVIDTSINPVVVLTLDHAAPSVVQNGENVNVIYRAKYASGVTEAGVSLAGQPVPFRTLKVTDDKGVSVTKLTGANGVANFSFTGLDQHRVFSAAIVPDLPTFNVTPVVTKTDTWWTALVLTRVNANDLPRTTLYANPSEVYYAAYRLTSSQFPSGVAGASVTLTSTDQTSSDVTGNDGLVTIPLVSTTPSTVTFDSSATSDPLSTTGVNVTVHWAKVVFDALVSPNGWHNVTDTAAFSFHATLVDGATSTNAGGATTTVDIGGNKNTLTTDSTGNFTTTFKFDNVTDAIPTIRLVSTPQGITRGDANTFTRQRWTEINLGLTPDKTFVNAGDTITYAVTATWAHHEAAPVTGDNVTSVTFKVLNATHAIVTTCTAVNGVGTCPVTQTGVYAGGLTFTITASSTDVIRPLAGTDPTSAPIWTLVDVNGAAVDDSLVNVGDNVTLTATLTYAHDHSVVPWSAVTQPAPVSGCTLLKGNVTNGALVAQMKCTTILNATGAAALPLVLTSASNGVTKLNGSSVLALSSIWTKVQVEYTTDTSRKLLSPDAPVVFSATVTYAHDGSKVNQAAVMVKSNTTGDTDEFVCITDTTGTCTVEITKHLGKFTFGVTAFSTTLDGFNTPDITAMNNTPATTTYRWTAVTFDAFQCKVGPATSSWTACDGQNFTTGQFVTVKVTAIAADNHEVLGGAIVKLDGTEYTAGADGTVSKTVTRFSTGNRTITARGVTATLEGETISGTIWTIPKWETLQFV